MSTLLIGVAERPLEGQPVSGDAYLAVEDAASSLLCVIDGLGHGPEAARAAQAAVTYVRGHAADEIEATMRALDDQLRSTRGAAITIVRVDHVKSELQYCGVGNVTLRAFFRKPAYPVNVPGIVGKRPRRYLTTRHRMEVDDTFVVYTDGISSRWEAESTPNGTPQAIANDLLARHGKAHDDVTCIVARMQNGTSQRFGRP